MESEKNEKTSEIDADKVIANDTVGVFQRLFKKRNSLLGATNEVQPVAIDTDSKYYDTTNDNRGVALIFNHYKFSSQSLRIGTNKDRDDIENVLKKFDFDVRVYNDLKKDKLMEVLAKVAHEKHSSNDCIVIVIMTHGGNGTLSARNKDYSISELLDTFVENNSLIGKPKLVFIQACRGKKLDLGSKYDKTDGDRADSVTVLNNATYYVPQIPDLLVMFSTFEGHYSWRNPTDGSWFIQSLCDELLQNGDIDDLLTILTGVARRVAYRYQSYWPENNAMDCKKQIPCITSMLTKTLYFTRKNK